MNLSIPNMVPESFNHLFQASLQIHPCSYDPTSDLKPFPGNDENSLRCIMPLESKATRFYLYCEEHQKTGRILTSDYHIDTYSTPEGLTGFATVTAQVYIDDTLVGSAVAGQSFLIGNHKEMDCVLQMASGLAKSRALTNAGFGTVSGTDLDSSSTVPNPNMSVPTNFNPGNVQAPAGSTANNFVPPPAPIADPAQQDMQAAFAQLGGQNDPLTQAKATPYPLSGYYQGKALGSLKTYILERFVSQPTNPNIAAAQDAARLILEERRNSSGSALV